MSLSSGVDGFTSRRLAAGVRLILFFLWIAFAVALHYAVRAVGGSRFFVPRLFHKGCTYIVGLKIVTRGAPSTVKPTLYVANHSSYLDITVLGALLTGSFVAKSEVSGWPLFGFLSKLQQTVFIERRNRAGVGKQADDLRGRLEAGDSLILFPEGTSSDGNRTLPFKTALFAVASLKTNDQPLTVQPISVAATQLDGAPMGLINRPLYAWYGDMDLAPHLWRAFGAGVITIEVEFHPPVSLNDFTNRKALADHCQHAVATGLSRALSGRAAPSGGLAAKPAG